MTPNHLELKSADGTKLNLEALYQIAPSCFTEVKDEKTGELRHVVNFTTLRQLLGDDAVDDAPEMYQFTWPGKQEARREAARPITDTLRPCPEESVDWDTTQNLYIEGDNLAVLKLLQKGYMGKVKMIYIDPPYNTGNDFVYHDDFAVSQKEMDLFSGDVDEEGNRYRKNTDSNGRFHSDWCSMMFSRLQVANTLLTDDGVIFISMDDNEIRNLRNIADEVFGERNFVDMLKWKKKKQPSFLAKHTSKVMEYVLVYAKEKDYLEKLSIEGTSDSTKKVINISNNECLRVFKPGVRVKGEHDGKIEAGEYMIRTMFVNYLQDVIIQDGRTVNEVEVKARFSVSQEKIDKYIDEDLLFITAQKGLRRDVSQEEIGSKKSITDLLLSEWGDNQESDSEFLELFPKKYFEYVKPTKLIYNLVKCNETSNQIILDFFSGSATTAQAVMQLNAEDSGNRKFILVQLDEQTAPDSEAAKDGYRSIPEIAKERIRRAGKKIKEESGLMTQDLDTGFRVFKLSDSNFNEVYFSPKDFSQDFLLGLESNIKEGRTDLDLLFGAMLDWGVQLSLPMSKETVDGCDIYTVNEGDLVACFSENVTENVVSAMAAKMPLRVLFRDSCFSEDKAKINVFELFKQKLDWGEDEAIKNIRVI